MNICCSPSNQSQKNVKSGSLTFDFKSLTTGRSYKIKAQAMNGNELLKNPGYEEVIFDIEKNTTQLNLFPWITLKCYKIRKSNNMKEIVLLKIENLNSYINQNNNIGMSGLSILYSSDNIKDLGANFSFLVDLSTQFKMNVWSYEYSAGKEITFEEEINDDIFRVNQFINNHAKEDLILIGHSFGSIPTLNIVEKKNIKNISGIILISPVGKNLNNKITLYSTISFPTFLVHGRKDKVVNYTKSVNNRGNFSNLFEWYPRKADHYNLISKYRTKLYCKMKFFLQQIQASRTNSNNITQNGQEISTTLVKKFTNFSNTSSKNFILKFEENFIFNDTINKTDKHSPIIHCFEPLNPYTTNGDSKLVRDLNKYNNNMSLRKSTCSTLKMDKFPFDKKVEEV